MTRTLRHVACSRRTLTMTMPASDVLSACRRAMMAFVAAMVLFTPAMARADERGAPAAYQRDKRVAHLAAAIDGMTAMGDAGRRAFDIAIYDAVRMRCKPGNRPAPTACLIAAAREVCAGKADGCLAVADVIITNQHAEKSLLDEATRMRLVNESADYHLGVIAALEARWAVLATELALASSDGTMAERIDRLCHERDREVRQCSAPEANGLNAMRTPTCVGTIAYQRCAAGLVWFTTGPRSTL